MGYSEEVYREQKSRLIMSYDYVMNVGYLTIFIFYSYFFELLLLAYEESEKYLGHALI